METVKRISKKKQYINGLLHDRDFLRSEIKRCKESKGIFFYWLGDRFSTYVAGLRVKEISEELQLILDNPNYKPWA